MKHRILVIEDERALRANICEILEMHGYEVASAESGAQGLESARSSPPDLILCDILMPVMNGHEFLELARKSEELRNIPVVFLTALTAPHDVRLGMNLGADDYITKPFDAKDLIAAIEGRIERSRLIAEDMQERIARIVSNAGSQSSENLNDSLNSIVLPAQLLSDAAQTLSAEQVRQLAGGILRSAATVARTVDNILWLQRLQAGNIANARSPFEVTREWAVRTIRASLREGGEAEVFVQQASVACQEEILSKILREIAATVFAASVTSKLRVQTRIEGNLYVIDIETSMHDDRLSPDLLALIKEDNSGLPAGASVVRQLIAVCGANLRGEHDSKRGRFSLILERAL